jgi:hypothetical protein
MQTAYHCPKCGDRLWAMLCGAHLAPSDLIVCVVCDFFETVGPQASEPVTTPEREEAYRFTT